MKITKLKIDSFFDTKLENLSTIVGGGVRPRGEAPITDGETGGSTVSNGSGSGHPPPVGLPPVTIGIIDHN